MKNKPLIYISVILGILFVILAIVYWTTTAGSLPSFIPGHIDGSTTIHLKHGIGSLILGLALFAFAWFKSGKKSETTLN
jgi:hypothetical protein